MTPITRFLDVAKLDVNNHHQKCESCVLNTNKLINAMRVLVEACEDFSKQTAAMDDRHVCRSREALAKVEEILK